ncbi:hypothetical protein BaRGS_00039798 [Batillaria attramentaria]|uniref:Acyl-CoA-binding domain-containing protein 6 n=1 Tax=Batillaria attramentaria TaxID=370345 RepID=A0ABD0J2Z6_9CAEN
MDDEADEFDSDESLESVFKSAANYVRQIGSKLDADKLLYFYARFKQANEGTCATAKPGFFDFQGKQKWDAWKKLGDMSKKEAMLEYVSLLTNIEPEWQDKMQSGAEGGDSQGQRESLKNVMGVSVSTMVCPDEQLTDQQKTIFHWCQEGNMDKVKAMLTSEGHQINEKDSQGMGLLHWASDRGLVDMVTMLLDSGADINLQDSDGQTALHYAVSCEHRNVVETLMARHADVTVTDSDGSTALDLASDDMKELLQSESGVG